MAGCPTFFVLDRRLSQPVSAEVIDATAVAVGPQQRLGIQVQFNDDLLITGSLTLSNFLCTINGAEATYYTDPYLSAADTLSAITTHTAQDSDVICFGERFFDPAFTDDDGNLVLGFGPNCDTYLVAKSPLLGGLPDKFLGGYK
jgi:hypothetical protein